MNKAIKILFILLALAAASCGTVRTNSQYNNPPGYITIQVSPSVIDANTSVVSLTITNNSEETAQFGANYTIERYAAGEWVEFDRPEFAVIAIMYMLPAGHTESYEINLFPDQADYTPGRYRIVKNIVLDLSGDSYYTAEFTIR